MDATAPYEIRVLGPGDAGLLRQLLDCFAEVFDDSETYRSAQPDDEYLEGLLSGDVLVAIVAISERRVVGGLAGYELPKFEQMRSELFIYDLGVREPYRRRGIASALLEESKRVARSRGAWVVFVQADVGDEPAVALYAKFGVREDSTNFDIHLDGPTASPSR